jgi:hypothetical protein
MKKQFDEKDQIPSGRPDDFQMKPVSADEAAKILWKLVLSQKKRARFQRENTLLIFHAKSNNFEKLKNAELSLYKLLCAKQQNPFFEKVKEGEPCFRSKKRPMYRLMIRV